MGELIHLGNKKGGRDNPTFVIAEAGINHGGDMEMAIKLIEKAAECEADAVKFQTYITEKRVDKNSPIFDILKKCELNEEDHKELIRIADKNKITFFSTPFDKESIDLLHDLNVQFYKIASFYLVNEPFLEYISKKGRPLIASRGMANTKEVDKAVEIFKRNNADFALLHCVSAYPTEYEDANLNIIRSLKEKYDCVVGYSDHSLGIDVPVYAVGVGASIIEKHFTLSKNLEGPDHKLSADPQDLRAMIEKIRKLDKILGSGEIRLLESEKGTLPFRKFYWV